MASVNARITPERAARELAGTFPGNLGVELLEIGEDGVRGRMRIDDRHLHPFGGVHGGAFVAFADTMAAWGTRSRLSEGENFTTAEMKVNLFASAGPGDELTATASPAHLGRRTQVWEVRIARDGRPAALFVCTQVVLRRPAEAGD